MQKSRDNAGRGKRPARGRHAGKGIKSNRKIGVRDVKKTRVMHAIARQGIDHCIGEIAVRIDDTDAVAGENIGHDEVEQHRRFAAAALAQQHQVTLALLVAQHDGAADRRRGYGWKVRLHKPEAAPGARIPSRVFGIGMMAAERPCGKIGRTEPAGLRVEARCRRGTRRLPRSAQRLPRAPII